MLGQKFDANALYNRIVHYYIDKKSYSKEKANAIAQTIVAREMQRRICKNIKCKHSMDEHVRAQETCLVLDCDCRRFVR
ncbi:MAG TPA: hypothetical protein VJJ01_00265 [Nitrosopumilaceae archaeon]|jgi:hypothetical protein|nr:hypothetical protein [Nitrosopumilaceae archaeon]